MLSRFLLLFLLAPGFGCACDCIKASARDAKHGADVVFRVNRVGKGPFRDEIETVAWVGDSCEAYAPGVLQTGNELLVYAHRVAPDPEFFPIRCSTQLVRDAAKDIEGLGRGRKPKPK
jgi:hypothetical protein